jgi:hypothetical protein
MSELADRIYDEFGHWCQDHHLALIRALVEREVERVRRETINELFLIVERDKASHDDLLRWMRAAYDKEPSP